MVFTSPEPWLDKFHIEDLSGRHQVFERELAIALGEFDLVGPIAKYNGHGHVVNSGAAAVKNRAGNVNRPRSRTRAVRPRQKDGQRPANNRPVMRAGRVRDEAVHLSYSNFTSAAASGG